MCMCMVVCLPLQTRLGGMLNGHGTKIRLTMKADTRELWIGSAERTQKSEWGVFAQRTVWHGKAAHMSETRDE